jgi:hypothetical protein
MPVSCTKRERKCWVMISLNEECTVQCFMDERETMSHTTHAIVRVYTCSASSRWNTVQSPALLVDSEPQLWTARVSSTKQHAVCAGMTIVQV